MDDVALSARNLHLLPIIIIHEDSSLSVFLIVVRIPLKEAVFH